MANKSILNVHNCYGCGVCSAACPKKIISIKLNKNGFYEPKIIDEDKCINCGLCISVCAYQYNDLALQNVNIKSWAAWSNNENIRKKCSSGGIGFEIGKQLLEKGYKVVGCRYNVKKQRAEHYIACTINDFIQSIGSKYIQSYTEEAFKAISRIDQRYLITGTPCQIDSFRRMIQKFHCEENFILMDFFCHCVPSMLAWEAYIKMLKPKIGKITYASWRNKCSYGSHDRWIMKIDGEYISKPIDWHDSYNILIKGEKTFIQSKMSTGDLFYKLFLNDLCHGPQCETKCKYKYDQSSADIRIGDLWGKTYKNDEKGVSALISFTEKGHQIIEGLNDITIIEHPFDIVAEGQMKSNVKSSKQYWLVMWLLRKRYTFSQRMWNFILFFGSLPYRIIAKLNKFVYNG